jgi:ABC-type transporter MlaC component
LATISRTEREARFRRLLNDHFDMAAISKFVLGRHWRSANEAQRVEFQQLFVDFIVRSYWVSFSDGLRGVTFTVTGSSTGGNETILVHSRIDMPSSENIRVDWRLRAGDGSFPILDIIVEGVSMGVTHRSEFASVIQSHGGVDGLIEVLRMKNLQSASRSAKPNAAGANGHHISATATTMQYGTSQHDRLQPCREQPTRCHSRDHRGDRSCQGLGPIQRSAIKTYPAARYRRH